MTEDITGLAREYLRAVNEHEAKKEALLADWADEYYRPGYLSDDEWEFVKDQLAAGQTGDAAMQIEIATYRRVFTEAGRADEIDGDWPAKNGTVDP